MKNNRHNCKLILEHDPLLKDVFRHNILTEQTDIVKPVWWERISPAFTDMDLNYIMLYLENMMEGVLRSAWDAFYFFAIACVLSENQLKLVLESHRLVIEFSHRKF